MQSSKKFSISEECTASNFRVKEWANQEADRTDLLSFRASCMPCFLTLEKETVHFSETSLNFQQTTWDCIPEDGIDHSRCYGNLKSEVNSVHVSNKWNILAAPVIAHLRHCLYAIQFCLITTTFLARGFMIDTLAGSASAKVDVTHRLLCSNVSALILSLILFCCSFIVIYWNVAGSY
jgi:hypothetical protein